MANETQPPGISSAVSPLSPCLNPVRESWRGRERQGAAVFDVLVKQRNLKIHSGEVSRGVTSLKETKAPSQKH